MADGDKPNPNVQLYQKPVAANQNIRATPGYAYFVCLALEEGNACLAVQTWVDPHF